MAGLGNYWKVLLLPYLQVTSDRETTKELPQFKLVLKQLSKLCLGPADNNINVRKGALIK